MQAQNNLRIKTIVNIFKTFCLKNKLFKEKKAALLLYKKKSIQNSLLVFNFLSYDKTEIISIIKLFYFVKFSWCSTNFLEHTKL